MATFEERIEGLTGILLTGSSSPTQAEVTEYLKDGVLDVQSRHIAMDRSAVEHYIKASAEQSSNGLDINGAAVISVIRSRASNDWRECLKIPIYKQARALDPDSLDFASTINPVYTVDDNYTINVYPIPGGSSNFKVYYVNNVPQDKGGSSLVYSHSDIKYFDDSKVYLVVIYASIRALQNQLQFIANISTFSASATAPTITVDAPSISSPLVDSISIESFGTAPVYTAPTVGGATEELTATISNDTDADANKLDFSDWFEVAGDFIQTEEDEELAQMQLNKISVYLQAYSQAMQNQLNTFNDSNVEYQATIQKNIDQANINMRKAEKDADVALQTQLQEYASKLQKLSAEITAYQMAISSEVLIYQQEIAQTDKEYTWMFQRMRDLKQEYNEAFGIMAKRNEE